MPNARSPAAASAASAASAARAARLRDEISGIQSGAAKGAPAADEPPPTAPLSPRDFVQKRMRDLDTKPG